MEPSNQFQMGRVVEAIDRLTETLKELSGTQSDHGRRIGWLERWVLGAAAAVAAFIAWLGADAFNITL